MASRTLRLAEPLAALSAATDLARGQPPEQALGAAVVAAELARRLRLSPAERSQTYFASLLRFAGCTATSLEYSMHLGGDDIAVRFGGDAIDPADPAQLSDLLARLGKGGMGLGDALKIVAAGTRADCEVGARMAIRLGLDTEVAASILHIFERWDGHGLPNNVPGPEIPRAARIGAVASAASMFVAAGGPALALEMLGDWSGRILDPEITACFASHADELFALLASGDMWEAALAAEPRPWRRIDEAELDGICRVFGDFADLKAPFLLGHSARVSALAEGAARRLGLDEAECVLLRRAGLLHDLGRVGVSTGIWEKTAALSTLEAEQARLHPYHSERILELSEHFRPLARVVGQHHERADGSGYFRGVTAPALSRAARILAAADACAELVEGRPGVDACTLDEAAMALSGAPLDPEAVEAVLGASGVRTAAAPPKPRWPAGLTNREVEVLRLLARGLSLQAVAGALVISYSTAHSHAAHVYAKLGVSTRAGAALFAMEHGLLS